MDTWSTIPRFRKLQSWIFFRGGGGGSNMWCSQREFAEEEWAANETNLFWFLFGNICCPVKHFLLHPHWWFLSGHKYSSVHLTPTSTYENDKLHLQWTSTARDRLIVDRFGSGLFLQSKQSIKAAVYKQIYVVWCLAALSLDQAVYTQAPRIEFHDLSGIRNTWCNCHMRTNNWSQSLAAQVLCSTFFDGQSDERYFCQANIDSTIRSTCPQLFSLDVHRFLAQANRVFFTKENKFSQWRVPSNTRSVCKFNLKKFAAENFIWN